MFQTEDIEVQHHLLNRVADLPDDGTLILIVNRHGGMMSDAKLRAAHEFQKNGTILVSPCLSAKRDRPRGGLLRWIKLASRSKLIKMPLATNFGGTMIGRIALAAISLCIGACASSGPETPGQSVADSSAGAEAVVSEASSAPPEGAIQEMDAPKVQATARVLEADDSDTIVCRSERQTGSKMTVRVCRTRAEIEERAAKDQESIRNSRATQSAGSCTLNTC